jgi:galactonate dehydratase
MEPFRLMWLEEPVPPDNIDAMVDIRHSTSTPICCGENIYMRWGFRELLEKRAVDIIMPDFQKCGGLLEARKIADLAHTYFVPVAPHGVTSPIGMMATAHVCSVIPNFLVQEWHWIDYMDLWTNWVKEGDIIDKGYISPPDRPGFGVELVEEVAKRRQVPGTPWFEPLPNAGRGGRGVSGPGGGGGRGAPAPGAAPAAPVPAAPPAGGRG